MARKKAPPTLADQIRETIRQRGLTNYAVAKMAGVSESQVQRFMKGEVGSDLRLSTAGKLATALGLRLVPIEPPAE